MKTIALAVGTEKYDIEVPESWHEVRGCKFVAFLEQQKSMEEISDEALLRVLDIPFEVAIFLTPIDLYLLKKEIAFMLDFTTISQWLIDEITLDDGRKVYPPAFDFSDVTWEEFIFADTYAARNMPELVTAVLFRPEKDIFNENESRRVSFSTHGTANRLPLFEKVSDVVKNAVLIIFVSSRKRLADKYSALFVEKIDDGKSDTGDWLRVTRDLLGENFTDERKILDLPCNAVLTRLDKLIRESNKK